MKCKCSCKTLVNGTPQLAISQGVSVSLYEQQPDGSFALLESSSANNFDAGQPGGVVQWRADDQAIVYACPVRLSGAGSSTLLQRDPLFERYFQGVEVPDFGGNSARFTGGGGYMITNGYAGGIDGAPSGSVKPQTVNSPAGWSNTSYITGVPGSFTAVTGTAPSPLIATNFGGFGVPGWPPGAVFSGVTLTVVVGVSSLSFRDIVDNGIYLTLDGSTTVGTDQSKPYNLISGSGTWCPDGTATQETRTYSGWGFLPTFTEANASTFGISFNAKSLSGAGTGYIQSFTLTGGWTFPYRGLVYRLETSRTYALGPCNKSAITSNVGPVIPPDQPGLDRLRQGATVQVMNAVNRTCRDNWYSTWSDSFPPSHPRATTKTSPGVLCEWTDPTLVAYLDDTTGRLVGGWSGDNFCIAPPAIFAAGTSTYSGPLPYTFDGTTFTPATMDTLTLPGTDPSGWSCASALFARDGIHAALYIGPQTLGLAPYLTLCQRSGNNLGSWSTFALNAQSNGGVSGYTSTPDATRMDLSFDGSMLAFCAPSTGGAGRVHVYTSGGTLLANLVPSGATNAERAWQVNFSDDMKALVAAYWDGSLTGRTCVWNTPDGGVTWNEVWQNPFYSQGCAFSHAYRVPA